MAANFKETITTALEPIASEAAQPLGLKVHRIIVRGSDQTPVIELIIDGERAVTLEDCAVVSRQVNEVLETTKAIKGNFRLDVMSPGVEEPLTEAYQFRKNVGRLLKVQTKAELQDKTVTGRLTSITDDTLTLELNPPKGRQGGQRRETLEVPLDSIKTAVVQIEFNAPSPDQSNL